MGAPRERELDLETPEPCPKFGGMGDGWEFELEPTNEREPA